MALRTIAYDGASYKQQLTELLAKADDKGSEEKVVPYPVVTIVLYFGDKHWRKPKSLLKTLVVLPELRPYVNDYKINLFEIAFLSEEQVNMFKSDFKIVADYFVQKRKNQNYVDSQDTFNHVNEILQMMRAVTGDPAFGQLSKFVTKRKGKPITMCKVLSEIERNGQISLAARFIKKGMITIKQAAKELGMTPNKLQAALNKLSKSQ